MNASLTVGKRLRNLALAVLHLRRRGKQLNGVRRGGKFGRNGRGSVVDFLLAQQGSDQSGDQDCIVRRFAEFLAVERFRLVCVAAQVCFIGRGRFVCGDNVAVDVGAIGKHIAGASGARHDRDTDQSGRANRKPSTPKH